MKYRIIKFLTNNFIIISWVIIFIIVSMVMIPLIIFPYIVLFLLIFVSLSFLFYNLFYYPIYTLSTNIEKFIYNRYDIKKYEALKKLEKIKKDNKKERLSYLISKRQYGEINPYIMSMIKDLKK